MHKCPHCLSASISSFDKWISDLLTPATCSNCAGLSYVEHKATAIANLGVVAILVIGIWGSAQLMSFYPLAVGVPFAIFWFFLVWYHAPLVKTDIKKIADMMTGVTVVFYISVLMGIAWLIYYKVL